MDVVGIGEASVDLVFRVSRLPGRGERVLANTQLISPGGIVGNFLCALGKLGTECGFIGHIGDDDLGFLVREDFLRHNVDITRLRVRKESRTRTTIVMISDSGEKSIVIGPAEFPDIDLDRSDLDYMSSVRLLYLLGGDLGRAIKITALARERDQQVSLDLDASFARDDESYAAVRKLLQYVDILFVNARAMDLLIKGETSLKLAAKRVLDWGPRIVVMTMGSGGAIALTPEEEITQPAFEVEVIDTAGAGDCFHAAFVHGYLQGWDCKHSLVYASAAAAICIARPGTRVGFPTHQEIVDFLVSQGHTDFLPA